MLRLRLPPLESLDRLSARTALVSLGVLSAGIVVGLGELRPGRLRRADGRHAGDLGALYAVGLLLRRERRILRGRRFAAPARRRLRARRGRPPSDPLRVMRLALVGVSHRQAPVELRERVAVDRGERHRTRPRAGRRLRGRRPLDLQPDRALPASSDEPERHLDERASGVAARAAPGDDGAALAPLLYRLGDDSAALHLFRVAAGLDSLVPGEGEILGQVRDAFDGGSTGPLLDRLFRQALHAGRRARVETAIGESPASVPAAAAALAQQVFGDLGGRTRPPRRRRQDERADGAQPALARRRDRGRREPDESSTGMSSRRGSSRAPSGLDDDPRAARDVGRRRHVDERARLRRRPRTAAGRAPRPPRPAASSSSISPCHATSIPTLATIDGCFVYDIDDLEAVVEASLAGRRVEAVRAEQLVAVEAERFREWQASLAVVPAIASLRAHAEEIRSRRAGQGRGPPGPAARERAQARRVRDLPDRRQAPPPPDGAHEGGGRRRGRRGLC